MVGLLRATDASGPTTRECLLQSWFRRRPHELSVWLVFANQNAPLAEMLPETNHSRGDHAWQTCRALLLWWCLRNERNLLALLQQRRF